MRQLWLIATFLRLDMGLAVCADGLFEQPTQVPPLAVDSRPLLPLPAAACFVGAQERASGIY